MNRSRKAMLACLNLEPLAAVLAAVRQWPPARAASPLIGCLYAVDPKIRWHAVSALGAVIADLAAAHREGARNIMRRLIWSLNDESGGIGWGAPEALAEAMADDEGLAGDFGPVLVAYTRPDGSYLELPELQRGLMWGLGRVAAARTGAFAGQNVPRYLLPYLDSPDPEVRGLAARSLGLLQAAEARQRLATLRDDRHPFLLYDGGELRATTVGELAGSALARLG